MADYRYIYIFSLDRDPNSYKSCWAFSKLTLDDNKMSEEVISEITESNTLGTIYSLSNGYVRVQFVNGVGYALLFGFK